MKYKNLPKLDFNVTNRCNFRCIHCCFSSGERMLKEFSLKKIKNVLHNFKKIGGKRIDITGGEPMIRKDIGKIIKISKELGLKTELVTNGSLLSLSKLKQFKKLGLDDIAISLDGSDFLIYSKIRLVNKRTYQRVIQNIKHSVKLGFYTKINTVVFKSNLHNLVEITKQAINMGAKEHGLYYFSPIGRGNNNQQEVANPLEFIKIVRNQYPKFQNKIKLSIEVPMLENKLANRLNTSCYLRDPWHLQILPDGNVYPCAIMAACQKPLGNLYRESLEEIWHKANQVDFFQKNVKPLFKKYRGCVNYPSLYKLLGQNNHCFVCLCRKFKINQISYE